MWTHFHVADDGRIKLFTPEKCETCGGAVQAANSVGSGDSPAKLRRAGLKQAATLPPESWYDEDREAEACPNCPELEPES